MVPRGKPDVNRQADPNIPLISPTMDGLMPAMSLPRPMLSFGVVLLIACRAMPCAQAQSPSLFMVDEIKVVSTSGSVATRSAAGTTTPVTVNPQNTAAGSPLPALKPGTALATGPGGNAILSIPSVGKIVAGPETQLRVPEGAGTQGSLELIKGRLFLDVDAAALKKRGESTFRLKTPAALLAVKGTRFFAIAEGGNEVAGVHQGVVALQAAAAAAATAVDIQAGNAISLTGGQPGPVRPMTTEEANLAKFYLYAVQTTGNSLDMRFAAVPGTPVLLCIHETRRKDYAAFAANERGLSNFWESLTTSTKVAQDPAAMTRIEDHPVQSISWEEAQKFCTWLGKKEGRVYRLPTDREWSLAAGLGDLEKADPAATPEALDGKVKNVFPWEHPWPPKSTSGNYRDKSYRAFNPTDADYLNTNDSFPETSPVMSYLPNKLGFYDLGGNVSEWCEDLYSPGKPERVIRGGCWLDSAREALLSSERYPFLPTTQKNTCFGFRVVLDPTAPAP